MEKLFSSAQDHLKRLQVYDLRSETTDFVKNKGWLNEFLGEELGKALRANPSLRKKHFVLVDTPAFPSTMVVVLNDGRGVVPKQVLVVNFARPRDFLADMKTRFPDPKHPIWQTLLSFTTLGATLSTITKLERHQMPFAFLFADYMSTWAGRGSPKEVRPKLEIRTALREHLISLGGILSFTLCLRGTKKEKFDDFVEEVHDYVQYKAAKYNYRVKPLVKGGVIKYQPEDYAVVAYRKFGCMRYHSICSKNGKLVAGNWMLLFTFRMHSEWVCGSDCVTGGYCRNPVGVPDSHCHHHGGN